MPLLLLLETATTVCSVALARDGKLLSIRETSEKNSHAAVITLFIDEVIKEAGITMNEIDAVAVSEGPGSYTGLRIGVATAKGLCYALDKPMIAVGTLDAMAAGISCKLQVANCKLQLTTYNLQLAIPLIDARRMEVYSAVFDAAGTMIREIRAEIIDEHSFAEYLGEHAVIFAGDGALKCKPLFENHPNVLFLDDFAPSAAYMIPLAEGKFKENKFEDLAYFEPHYLKEFVAGLPRVKGLR